MKRLLPLLALLLPGCDSGYDRGYDTSVERPAYAGGGPRVLADQGHHNRHTMRGNYRPFVELLRNDGYSTRSVWGMAAR